MSHIHQLDEISVFIASLRQRTFQQVITDVTVVVVVCGCGSFDKVTTVIFALAHNEIIERKFLSLLNLMKNMLQKFN